MSVTTLRMSPAMGDATYDVAFKVKRDGTTHVQVSGERSKCSSMTGRRWLETLAVWCLDDDERNKMWNLYAYCQMPENRGKWMKVRMIPLGMYVPREYEHKIPITKMDDERPRVLGAPVRSKEEIRAKMNALLGRE